MHFLEYRVPSAIEQRQRLADAPCGKIPSYRGFQPLQAMTRNRLPRFFWETLAFDTNRNNA
jgi:hypothetical protein